MIVICWNIEYKCFSILGVSQSVGVSPDQQVSNWNVSSCYLSSVHVNDCDRMRSLISNSTAQVAAVYILYLLPHFVIKLKISHAAFTTQRRTWPPLEKEGNQILTRGCSQAQILWKNRMQTSTVSINYGRTAGQHKHFAPFSSINDQWVMISKKKKKKRK